MCVLLVSTWHAQNMFVTYLPHVQVWQQSHLLPGLHAMARLTAACFVLGSALAQKPCMSFCPSQKSMFAKFPGKPVLLWWQSREPAQYRSLWEIVFSFGSFPMTLPLLSLSVSSLSPADLCATCSPGVWNDLSSGLCVAPALFFNMSCCPSSEAGKAHSSASGWRKQKASLSLCFSVAERWPAVTAFSLQLAVQET